MSFVVNSWNNQELQKLLHNYIQFRPKDDLYLDKLPCADDFLLLISSRGGTPSSFTPGYNYFAHTGLNPKLHPTKSILFGLWGTFNDVKQMTINDSPFSEHCDWSLPTRLFNLIQLVCISFSGQGDETAEHVKLVRTGLNGGSMIPAVCIGIVAVPLTEFIFKIEYVGHRTVNNNVLTVQKTPA